MNTMKGPAFRLHELAFRTQYAELKERVRSTPQLLPGTPGTLVKREGTGRAYWYRVYQGATGKQLESLVCRDADEATLAQASDQLDFSKWVGTQVRTLRKLDFQVADKGVALVLVELHNAGLLGAGLCLVGTLGYMAMLNELGASAVTARTLDIDLATGLRLKLAAPQSYLEVLGATKMGFLPVPGLRRHAPASSVKLPGADGLRIDLLTHGETTGQSVAIAQLQWHAQTVPHYDYLLVDLREAAALAGMQCIPVKLPASERFMWHKLFSSAVRKSSPEKAAKDLRQGATLAAVLTQDDSELLPDSVAELPAAMRRVLVRQKRAILLELVDQPAAHDAIQRALAKP